MTPINPLDSRIEMFQRGHPQDAFFNMKALAPRTNSSRRERPMSDATEMFDTDFEDDDSDMEMEEENSPRLSLNSVSNSEAHRHWRDLTPAIDWPKE
jgi:hypothetical protein